MIGDRLALIRQKNTAFARLEQADLAIERRRHTAGEVPPSWLAKRAILAAEYRAAVAAVGYGRER